MKATAILDVNLYTAKELIDILESDDGIYDVVPDFYEREDDESDSEYNERIRRLYDEEQYS